MRYLKIGTRLGKQTLPRGANALLRLLFAGRRAEIGGRPADIVNISLEIRIRGKKLGFL